MDEKIEKSMEFLQKTYDESNYLNQYPTKKAYHLEHSIRVANIGKAIAEREGLNILNLTLGCLLHDVAYGKSVDETFNKQNHGRISAELARPFLLDLGLSSKEVEEICYGIAIHVDGRAGFEGNETPLATSIGDADQIDHYDAYRIFNTLKDIQYDAMPLEAKKDFVENKIVTLKNKRYESLCTQTASLMQAEKIDYQIDFYQKLLSQIRLSCIQA